MLIVVDKLEIYLIIACFLVSKRNFFIGIALYLCRCLYLLILSNFK